ncbi:MAG: sigma-54 dependent transcriptional regulator [Nitrospirota bacterium]
MEKILIVDDEKDLCWTITNLLNNEGYTLMVANDGKNALIQIKDTSPDLVILDLKLPDTNGIDLLSKIKEIDSNIPIIILTAYGEVSSAVNAMKMGAIDYIIKPFDINELRFSIKNALHIKDISLNRKTKGERLRGAQDSEGLVGNSPQIHNIIEQIKIVALSDMTVIIQGESGTGKDLVVKLLHSNSSRSHKPFVTVDCGTLPESLIESEMFGYEKGAFTGAEKTKEGMFELANGGTIFLNEIGNLSESAQRKFLGILENRQLQRLGGKKVIDVDVRVIAATNLPLKGAVKDGKFRQDLFFRLSQLSIDIPPLRYRVEDILPLAKYFLNKANLEIKKEVKTILPEAEKKLLLYPWPCNVRELKNVIKRAVLMARDSTIRMEDLSFDFESEGTLNASCSHLDLAKGIDHQFRIDARKAMNELEREVIRKALAQAHGNKKKAAEILGIRRSTIYYKMESLGMKTDE